MKKLLALILATLMLLSMVACNVETPPNNVNDDLSQNQTNNNKTENNGVDNSNNNGSSNNDNKNDYNITISVTNKSNIPEDIYNGHYSNRVEFSFSIKNNETKDIKGIKGVLKIQDLFGNSIMNLNCDFTGKKITKGTSTSFTGIGIDINEFMSNHTKLYNEKYDDLKFEYEIQKVVYYGVTTTTKTTYEEVTINVVNKYNLAEDIYNGRYSPEVLFDFDIFNKSNKSIKGIQGVLVVSDLFGDEIIRINCDFTGKNISSQDSEQYEAMGIEINEFMDSHVSLYNEDFSDLNFEYIIKTIVYTDGTSVSK